MDMSRNKRLLTILALGAVILLGACNHRLSITPTSSQAPRPSGDDKQVKLEQIRLSKATAPPQAAPPQNYCTLYSSMQNTDCYCREIAWGKAVNGAVPPLGEFCVPAPPYCERGAVGCQQGPQNQDLCNQAIENGAYELYCWAKPVIYLYPPQPTTVDVSLTIPGRVIVSDPKYTENGWQRVLAFPDGALLYQGNSYPYLYYETEVTKPEIPAYGVVIEKKHLASMLRLLTRQLGLVEHEQNDFLQYWLPQLEALDAPYIFATVLTKEQKQKTDMVVVSVEPDTRIELLFHFQPLAERIDVAPLPLPESPPERRGFTMVAWGGGIGE